MPSSDSRAGQMAPSLDNLCRRRLRVGEEPARSQFAGTVTTQTAQAYRLARDHPFEDRTPLYRGTDRQRSKRAFYLGSCSPVGGTNLIYSLRVSQGVIGSIRCPNFICVYLEFTRGESALGHSDRRCNEGAGRGPAGALRQQPEVIRAGCRWCVESLSPSVGFGRRRRPRSGLSPAWWSCSPTMRTPPLSPRLVRGSRSSAPHRSARRPCRVGCRG